MGKIIAGLSGVKGKFQYLHPWISRIPDQILHSLCNKSQILCNDLYLSQFPLYGLKEFQAGAILPLAMLCSLIPKRNGIILVKSPEVIDPHHIIPLTAASHPPDPPLISGRPVAVPVIKGIPPQLSGGRKPSGGQPAMADGSPSAPNWNNSRSAQTSELSSAT